MHLKTFLYSEVERRHCNIQKWKEDIAIFINGQEHIAKCLWNRTFIFCKSMERTDCNTQQWIESLQYSAMERRHCNIRQCNEDIAIFINGKKTFYIRQ